MKITEKFVQDILEEQFSSEYQAVYDASPLLQYLDKKMSAVHRGSKARRSLANIYAIYALLYFYEKEFFENPTEYREFEGYDYMRLFLFFRGLYGGGKLQNHALNSRVNGEFKNRFPDAGSDLILSGNGNYLLHINYLYAAGHDISRACCRIVEAYISLLKEKDHALLGILRNLRKIADGAEKKQQLSALLAEDADARIFEIISYAVLKNHFAGIHVFFGYSRETIQEEPLRLYRTGRTNANDGGIDFVMRPEGRFFQVTEVSNYDKYLLDIEKIMHFPITFVVKTVLSSQQVENALFQHVHKRSGGMRIVEDHYRSAVEEIITINELRNWIRDLSDPEIDSTIRDIDLYYRLEMNMDESAKDE